MWRTAEKTYYSNYFKNDEDFWEWKRTARRHNATSTPVLKSCHVEADADDDQATLPAKPAPAKHQSWSEQMSGMLSKESRPHMLEFLKMKGFLQK